MRRTSSLKCLGSEKQTRKDQLYLLMLCLGLIVISLMFQRCGKGKIWWMEERGCKQEERNIKEEGNVSRDPRLVFGFSWIFRKN